MEKSLNYKHFSLIRLVVDGFFIYRYPINDGPGFTIRKGLTTDCSRAYKTIF